MLILRTLIRRYHIDYDSQTNVISIILHWLRVITDVISTLLHQLWLTIDVISLFKKNLKFFRIL